MFTRPAHRPFSSGATAGVRLLASAAALAGFSVGLLTTAAPASAAAPRAYHDVEVLSATRGATVRAALPSGKVIGVRLLGIGMPMQSKDYFKNHCAGPEAHAALQALISQRPLVTLRVDPSQQRYDRSGRLMAYVEPQSGPRTTYQQELLKQGWATTKLTDGADGAQGSAVIRRQMAFERAFYVGWGAEAGVFSLCDGDFAQLIGDPLA